MRFRPNKWTFAKRTRLVLVSILTQAQVMLELTSNTGSPGVPAQIMQTSDSAHIGLSALIDAAGKFGVNISATKNVYFRDDLQLSPLKRQSVKISSPQAIAIFGALLLSHHLTLDLEGQQIEQCGGGNGRSILNGNLIFNASIDIGQYSWTPYQQVIIQNTRRLSANSGEFIRIIGSNEGTLRVRHVLSDEGPIDLRNQMGTVTIIDQVQGKSNSVHVCGHCKS